MYSAGRLDPTMTLNLGPKKKVSQNVEVRGKSGVVAKTIFDPRRFGLSRIDDGFWEGIEIRLFVLAFFDTESPQIGPRTLRTHV